MYVNGIWDIYTGEKQNNKYDDNKLQLLEQYSTQKRFFPLLIEIKEIRPLVFEISPLALERASHITCVNPDQTFRKYWAGKSDDPQVLYCLETFIKDFGTILLWNVCRQLKSMHYLMLSL